MRKEKYKHKYISISLMNIYSNIINKVLGHQIQQHRTMTMPHNKVQFIPGKNICLHI